MLSEARLAEIEARVSLTMDGPWQLADGYGGDGYGVYALGMEIANVQSSLPAEAAFIAHARQDVLELIAEVRRLLTQAADGSPVRP